jgi:hypothetical protein
MSIGETVTPCIHAGALDRSGANPKFVAVENICG